MSGRLWLSASNSSEPCRLTIRIANSVKTPTASALPLEQASSADERARTPEIGPRRFIGSEICRLRIFDGSTRMASHACHPSTRITLHCDAALAESAIRKLRLLDGEKMAGLCREFGISRKTGYKILTPLPQLRAPLRPPDPSAPPRRLTPSAEGPSCYDAKKSHLNDFSISNRTFLIPPNLRPRMRRGNLHRRFVYWRAGGSGYVGS